MERKKKVKEEANRKKGVKCEVFIGVFFLLLVFSSRFAVSKRSSSEEGSERVFRYYLYISNVLIAAAEEKKKLAPNGNVIYTHGDVFTAASKKNQVFSHYT